MTTLTAHAIKEKLNTAFDDVVQTPELFVVHPGTDFTRERKLPLRKLLSLLHGIRGGSIIKELFDYEKETGVALTASAFVQQRAKLLPDAFEYIFHKFNELCDDPLTYRGYHLYAIDGSQLRISGNSAETTFISQGNGKGYNMVHLNALYDIMNRTYRDCFLQHGSMLNERSAALELAKRVGLDKNSILIADRGYAGRSFMESLRRMGVNYLIRVKNNFWRELMDLPKEEFDLDLEIELRTSQRKDDLEAFAKGEAVWVTGPSSKGKTKKLIEWEYESPYIFKYRCVRIEITPGEYETLVTNLSKEDFPPSELKKLYGMRWGIETSFRELKYALGVINFHAVHIEHIYQEIWAKLTMYNFCERIARLASVHISKKGETKYGYQIHYTMAIYICIEFFRNNYINGPPDIAKKIARYILPVRPGRKDKRKEIFKKPEVFFSYRVA